MLIPINKTIHNKNADKHIPAGGLNERS